MISRRLLLGLPLLFLVTAQADTTPNSGDSAPAVKLLAPTNDVGLASDGTLKDQDSYQVRIGELRAPGGEAYILPLRIPAIPPGQRMATFHLRAQLARIDHDGGGLANADLYALGIRDSEKPLPGDYYQGPKPDPKATLIQANYLTPGSPVRTNSNTGPFIDTSAEADAALRPRAARHDELGAKGRDRAAVVAADCRGAPRNHPHDKGAHADAIPPHRSTGGHTRTENAIGLQLLPAGTYHESSAEGSEQRATDNKGMIAVEFIDDEANRRRGQA